MASPKPTKPTETETRGETANLYYSLVGQDQKLLSPLHLLKPDQLNLVEPTPYQYSNLISKYNRDAIPRLPSVTTTRALIERVQQFRDYLRMQGYSDPAGETLDQLSVATLSIPYDYSEERTGANFFLSTDEILSRIQRGTACSGMANFVGVLSTSLGIPSLIVGSLGPQDRHARLLKFQEGLWQTLNIQAYPKEWFDQNNILLPNPEAPSGHLALSSKPLAASTPQDAALSSIYADRFVLWTPDPESPNFLYAFNSPVYNVLRSALFSSGITSIVAPPQAEMPLFFERFGPLFDRNSYRFDLSGSSRRGSLAAGIPLDKQGSFYLELATAGSPQTGTQTGADFSYQWVNPNGSRNSFINLGLKTLLTTGSHFNDQRIIDPQSQIYQSTGNLHALLLLEADVFKIFGSKIILYDRFSAGLSHYLLQNDPDQNVFGGVVSSTTGALFPILHTPKVSLNSFLESSFFYGSPGQGGEKSDWLAEVLPVRTGLLSSFLLATGLHLEGITVFPAVEASGLFSSGPKGPKAFAYFQQRLNLRYVTSNFEWSIGGNVSALINHNPNTDRTTLDLGGIYGPGSAAGGDLNLSWRPISRLILGVQTAAGIKKDSSFYSQEGLGGALQLGSGAQLSLQAFHYLQTGVRGELDKNKTPILKPDFNTIKNEFGATVNLTVTR